MRSGGWELKEETLGVVRRLLEGAIEAELVEDTPLLPQVWPSLCPTGLGVLHVPGLTFDDPGLCQRGWWSSKRSP